MRTIRSGVVDVVAIDQKTAQGQGRKTEEEKHSSEFEYEQKEPPDARRGALGEGEEDKQAPGESSSSKSSKSEVSVRLEDIYIDPEERSITHDNPLLGERPIVYLQEGGSDKQE